MMDITTDVSAPETQNQAMVVSRPTPLGEGRSRAPLACGFCRRRKMRCSNDQPQCMNCKAFKEECVYTEIPKKATSSRSRISRLENENRRLQSRLANVTGVSLSRPVSIPSSSSSPNGVDLNDLIMSSNSLSSVSDSRSRSDDGDFTQTSKNRSGEYEYRNPARNSFDLASISHVGMIEWRQKQLMAEAANQRQLESINLEAGLLDFDGVNPELGMHLLALHWNYQHHSFMIVHRPTFMRDMACGGPYFSKLLLNAIYFGASKFSPRIEVQSDQYRQRARTLLAQSMDRSDITTIQALLLMTGSQFALGNERSAAWLNAGIAFRMIIDLGIQVDIPQSLKSSQFSVEDLEVRRRVFWAAFVIDKVQSLYRGRPVGLQAMNCQVPMTFSDQFEELELWQPLGFSGTSYPGVRTYSLSTFTSLCKLSIIMNRILNELYAEPSAESSAPSADLNALHIELEQWVAALPEHLKYDPSDSTALVPPPHVLSLLALYHVLHIQLHYPFVAEGQLHGQSPVNAADSFVICAASARTIVQLLRAYDRTFSIRKAPYLISYVAYVSATVFVQIAAQKLAGSEADEYLRTCLAVLNENQATNWGVRSAMDVILNLMKRMGVKCSDGGFLSEIVQGTSQPISVNAQHAAHLMHTEMYKGSAEAQHTRLMNSGSNNSIESDFDIDMILQGFAKEYDTGARHTSNSEPAPFRFSPIALPPVTKLEDSNGQEQMLFDNASADFDVLLRVGQNPIGGNSTSRPFF